MFAKKYHCLSDFRSLGRSNKKDHDYLKEMCDFPKEMCEVLWVYFLAKFLNEFKWSSCSVNVTEQKLNKNQKQKANEQQK